MLMNVSDRVLILVRHSAVQVEPDVPSREWCLSADGRFRCHQLAAQLAASNPALFVTSRERKAVETGQILAEDLGVAWQTAVNLHEHDRRGVPYFADKAAFEAAVAAFFNRPDELLLGRETAVQARDRFDTAVKQILADHPTGNIAVVAHGTVITLFLCRYRPDLSPIPFWRNLALPCYVEFPLTEMT